MRYGCVLKLTGVDLPTLTGVDLPTLNDCGGTPDIDRTSDYQPDALEWAAFGACSARQSACVLAVALDRASERHAKASKRVP